MTEITEQVMTDQEFKKLSVQEQYGYFLGCGCTFALLCLPLANMAIITHIMRGR